MDDDATTYPSVWVELLGQSKYEEGHLFEGTPASPILFDDGVSLADLDTLVDGESGRTCI